MPCVRGVRCAGVPVCSLLIVPCVAALTLSLSLSLSTLRVCVRACVRSDRSEIGSRYMVNTVGTVCTYVGITVCISINQQSIRPHTVSTQINHTQRARSKVFFMLASVCVSCAPDPSVSDWVCRNVWSPCVSVSRRVVCPCVSCPGLRFETYMYG